MTITRAIIGTLRGIPAALSVDDVDMDELYAVAEALKLAQNAVLEEALRRITLEEGYRLAAEYSARHRRPYPGGDAA